MKKKSTSTVSKRPPSRTLKRSAGNRLKTVISERQIRECVLKLAKRIDGDHQGQTLHVVGILDNCFLFMADLIRALKTPVICHFVRPEVHDSSAGRTPVREIKYTPPIDAAGKNVLLVDGILQSGLTLDHLYRYVLGQNPSSVRTATLIEKTDERKVDVATDYVGFKIAGKFLLGYGLDYQGKYRNLPYVATPA